MYSFPELIKKIRESADLTQAEFAGVLGVSTVLIAMVETGQKDVSKNLIRRIADLLNVHPSSITPFLFSDEKTTGRLSPIEKNLIKLGEKLQDHLIKNKAKLLRQYVR